MLKARVTRTTGNTALLLAHIERGIAVSNGALPVPSWVEIDVNSDGVFLLRRDAAGRVVADTWHLTVEDAKRQAHFEFGTDEAEWFEG